MPAAASTSPRPKSLGPLRDVARESGGRFAVTPASPLTTFEALLRYLTPAGGRPSLLLLEDIHWADESTLDLLRYLGRRIRTTPVLVVVTLRNDEPGSQERLAALWDDVPRDARERIELQRLSADAVQRLADRVPDVPAGELYAATGGNPFHVTEYLAAKPPEVPTSVRDATLAARAGCPIARVACSTVRRCSRAASTRRCSPRSRRMRITPASRSACAAAC